MAEVTIRYWAAAKEAAGMAEEAVQAETLREALTLVVARREQGSRLAAVLARSSFLVNADPVGKADKGAVILHEGAVIEVLPPFAGG
jgi:sulfur-carrier protein